MDYNELKKELKISTSIERRGGVIKAMDEFVKSGKNCFSCQGFCCTFSYNSMQVTPIEALDAYDYLRRNNRINAELITRLNECIKEYRLDHEIVLGGGRELRRQYTCPFFNAGPKGCSIEPESKPYGCLAFNPLSRNVDVEGKCTSYIDVLEKREIDNSDEEAMNQLIKKKLSIYWEKKNFPVALKNLIILFQ
jgi:Fe-S-cluster containining protein